VVGHPRYGQKWNFRWDVLKSKGKIIINLHARGTDGWASNALLLSAKNIQNCSVDLETRIQHYLKDNSQKNKQGYEKN
jgi:hypothetical protein